VTTDDRMDWIEPQIKKLDVRETSQHPGGGADHSVYPDCSRS
jgi:hypothetical protein